MMRKILLTSTLLGCALISPLAAAEDGSLFQLDQISYGAGISLLDADYNLLSVQALVPMMDLNETVSLSADARIGIGFGGPDYNFFGSSFSSKIDFAVFAGTRVTFPLTEQVGLHASVGFSSVTIGYDNSDVSGFVYTNEGSSFGLGVLGGAEYQLSDSLGLYGEFQALAASLGGIALGASYRF